MGMVTFLLTLPVMGPAKLTHWLATTIAEEARKQSLDEGPVRAELLAIQELYDAGEISEEEYDRQERTLLERLNAIRKSKAQQT